MSGNPIADEVYERRVEGSIGYSIAVLVLYEYCITFEYEVSIVWTRKWTATSLAFLANRSLLTVPTVVGLLYQMAPVTKAFSEGSAIMNQVFALLSIVQISFLTALRASALWDFNRVLFFVIFILGCVPFGTNLYGQIVSQWVVEQDPWTGAPVYREYFNVSEQLNMIMLYLSRLSPIIADFLVLVFTWLKTYSQLRDARLLGMKLPLSTCLARDGSLYFVVILVANLMRLFVSDIPALFGVSPMNQFTQSLPQILMQRFLINLRQVSEPEDASDTEMPQQSVVFGVGMNPSRSMMGNIGEPLAFDQDGGPWSGDSEVDDEGDSPGMCDQSHGTTQDSTSAAHDFTGV